MDFAQVIQAELDRRGWNVNQAEANLCFPQGYIRGIVREDEKRAIPSVQKAEQIARALGLDFYFGPPRETGPIELIKIGGVDYAHVPLHDAMLAAGSGSSNDAEQVIDHIAFRRDWLIKVGVPASAARLARVHGDSMQPTVWDGDLILIDTRNRDLAIKQRGVRDRRRSPVYALIDDGEARIKRIERSAADAMLLISDNPDYPPELRQGEDIQAIKIIGKVVWWGHTARE